MLGEARGYAAAIVIQHLLRTLEAKGIMEPTETAAMLDGILEAHKPLCYRQEDL